MRDSAADDQDPSRLGSSPALLDAARERELIAAALRGDVRATRAIVLSHMRLVGKIARRYRRRELALEDLVSEGLVGLMEALRRFDLARGVRFSVYASWWIRARVSRYALENRRAVGMPSTRNARTILRDMQRTERRLAQRLQYAPSSEELARELDVPACEVAEVRMALGVPDLSLEAAAEGAFVLADERQSPEAALTARQLGDERRRRVARALSLLSARERMLVRAQYWEEGGRSLSELGRASGVSRQRLGQVLHGAREKLRLTVVRSATRGAGWEALDRSAADVQRPRRRARA